ncbi:MAG: TerC family protein [Bryobacteraceae bacterium]|nr:TerC family protein [Bryobacteraceae bacterium]MDW8379576.1 TerC family protein [Bryobacterales bacterium]
MELHTQFLIDILSIVLIDLLLAGDNAVVIALAVKSLPARERKIGIMAGAGVAVVLRIVLTFFASQLLQVQFVKLVGGVLILWIAVKLLLEDTGHQEHGKQATTLFQAMLYILIADVTMSTDNILAIAGTSKGNLGLLIFGLGLSIPFVVFTSKLLSSIMERFPIIVWIGAAILGRVGGEMIMTDPWLHQAFAPPKTLEYAVQAALAIGVVALGRFLARREKPDPVRKLTTSSTRQSQEVVIETSPFPQPESD